MYEYKAIMRSVYDADTVRFDIDLGFHIWVSNQPVRFYGIDAWEVRGVERPEGLLAKQAVLDQFERTGAEVTLKTYKDSKGKYGRWLGTIILSDGLNLNEWLVENGHAEVYG